MGEPVDWKHWRHIIRVFGAQATLMGMIQDHDDSLRYNTPWAGPPPPEMTDENLKIWNEIREEELKAAGKK